MTDLDYGSSANGRSDAASHFGEQPATTASMYNLRDILFQGIGYDAEQKKRIWQQVSLNTCMYCCSSSKIYPSGRDCSAEGRGRRAVGDRVGLMVEQGKMSIYVNGSLLEQGPMATGLTKRVRVRKTVPVCVKYKYFKHIVDIFTLFCSDFISKE